MTQRALILLAALALGTSVAEADIVHLKHGRTVEGTVLKTTDQEIRVRVKQGGVMTLPKHLVKRVESRASANADYAWQVTETDMTNPASIERLALWAAQRGMGEKASQLNDMAQGLRLELRVGHARARESAQAFADTFHWARSARLADEVLLWILSEGSKIDAQDPGLKRAYAKFNADLDARARRAARLQEIRRRPSYAMPVDERTLSSEAAAQVEMARIRGRKKTSLTRTQATQNGTWIDRMRALRQAELEKQLERKRTRRTAKESADADEAGRGQGR